MKKLIGYVALAAGLLVAGSCQKESAHGGEAQETVNTAFRVEIPSEEATKAVSEAENVDIVFYEVWDEEFEQRLFPYEGSMPNLAQVHGGVAEIIIDLVKDQKFNLIFWAQNASCKDEVYSWTDLKNINVDYSKFTEDQKDVYDAFYAVEEDVMGDGQSRTIYLYRPFAQVNFCASEMSTPTLGPITLSGNTVTVSDVATRFNTLTGLGDAAVKDVSFSTGDALVSDETINVGGIDFSWVAMNYLLVPCPSVDKPAVNVTVSADFLTNFGTVHQTVLNVPIQRNYRTNIVGDLFSVGANLRIEVVPGFTGDKPTIEIK
jgi:hypothetical protein